jgi:hypothetical protein
MRITDYFVSLRKVLFQICFFIQDSGEVERLTLKDGFAFMLFKEEKSVQLACRYGMVRITSRVPGTVILFLLSCSAVLWIRAFCTDLYLRIRGSDQWIRFRSLLFSSLTSRFQENPIYSPLSFPA